MKKVSVGNILQLHSFDYNYVFQISRSKFFSCSSCIYDDKLYKSDWIDKKRDARFFKLITDIFREK